MAIDTTLKIAMRAIVNKLLSSEKLLSTKNMNATEIKIIEKKISSLYALQISFKKDLNTENVK